MRIHIDDLRRLIYNIGGKELFEETMSNIILAERLRNKLLFNFKHPWVDERIYEINILRLKAATYTRYWKNIIFGGFK